MTKKIDNSVYEMWQEFISENSDFKSRQQPIPFYFCDNEYDANDCANLVIKKNKQATAASLWWYEKNNEKLPEIGDINIITDWNGKAKAIIETTKIEKVRYHEITPEFARMEGEGDKSLAYWKDVHWNYYSREMKPHNEKPANDMIIVCEYFKTIWVKK
ncbi:MAG: ASCH domain-containing protein [Cyclobacteriaceae bacterium]|nr:ASCH domain-containing protein [Cyclobacteriaceae bacterium]